MSKKIIEKPKLSIITRNVLRENLCREWKAYGYEIPCYILEMEAALGEYPKSNVLDVWNSIHARILDVAVNMSDEDGENPWDLEKCDIEEEEEEYQDQEDEELTMDELVQSIVSQKAKPPGSPEF